MLSIIVPVYNGGVLFLRALDSLEENGVGIENIYISFNAISENSKDVVSFRDWIKRGLKKHNYQFWITGCELSSKDHGIRIIKSLKTTNAKYIMTLCHDDRIEEKYDFSQLDLYADKVIFPTWRLIDEKFQFISEKKIISDSPDQLIMENEWSCYINISGIIYPKKMLQRLSWILPLKKGGQRVEMSICTQPEIKKIIAGNHKVEIMVRDQSDGASASKKQYAHDELIYIATLIWNRRFSVIFNNWNHVFQRVKGCISILCE
jgi:glycosyltransferase involved in cell wall biosynthesis